MMDKRIFPLLMLKVGEKKPILGKTKFMKLMYISGKELAKAGISVNFYNFFKHYYGPYADELTKDLDSLVNKKFVSHDMRINGIFEENIHTLTNKGEQLIPKEIDGRIVKIFENVKNKYGDMPLSSLIREVYANYPIAQL